MSNEAIEASSVVHQQAAPFTLTPIKYFISSGFEEPFINCDAPLREHG
jgi:hypothetical protein